MIHLHSMISICNGTVFSYIMNMNRCMCGKEHRNSPWLRLSASYSKHEKEKTCLTSGSHSVIMLFIKKKPTYAEITFLLLSSRSLYSWVTLMMTLTLMITIRRKRTDGRKTYPGHRLVHSTLTMMM